MKLSTPYPFLTITKEIIYATCAFNYSTFEATFKEKKLNSTCFLDESIVLG